MARSNPRTNRSCRPMSWGLRGRADRIGGGGDPVASLQKAVDTGLREIVRLAGFRMAVASALMPSAAANHVRGANQMVEQVDGEEGMGGILVALRRRENQRRHRTVGQRHAVDHDSAADPRRGGELAGEATDVGGRDGR